MAKKFASVPTVLRNCGVLDSIFSLYTQNAYFFEKNTEILGCKGAKISYIPKNTMPFCKIQNKK